MWTGKGRAGACSPSCFSSCTETDSGGGENPNSAPGLELWLPPGGRQPPPERVHLPLPAPGRGALKKKTKKQLCAPSVSRIAPNPSFAAAFLDPPRDLQPPPGDGAGGAGGTRGLFPPKSPPHVFLLRAGAEGSDGNLVGFGPICLVSPPNFVHAGAVATPQPPAPCREVPAGPVPTLSCFAGRALTITNGKSQEKGKHPPAPPQKIKSVPRGCSIYKEMHIYEYIQTYIDI